MPGTRRPSAKLPGCIRSPVILSGGLKVSQLALPGSQVRVLVPKASQREKYRDDVVARPRCCGVALVSRNPVTPVIYMRSHAYICTRYASNGARSERSLTRMAKQPLLLIPSHTSEGSKEEGPACAWRASGNKTGRVASCDAIRCVIVLRLCRRRRNVVSHSEADRGGSSSAPRSGN